MWQSTLFSFQVLFLYLHICWGGCDVFLKRNSCDTCYSSQRGPRFARSVGIPGSKHRHAHSCGSDLAESSRPAGEQLFCYVDNDLELIFLMDCFIMYHLKSICFLFCKSSITLYITLCNLFYSFSNAS